MVTLVPTVSFSITSVSIGEVIDIVFIYLTPLIPLSFEGEGEEFFEEGLRPSWTPCNVSRVSPLQATLY
jgi:hypothetical protein